MKRLFLLFLLLPYVVFAQFDKRGGGAVTGLDEGTSLGTFTSLDAVGAGITATLSGDVLTLTIPGAGSATFTVQEDDVTLSTVVTVLDFLGADFDITESPSGEANIVIAAAIARDSELHSAITLSGTPDYITLSGQDIVRGLIVLTTDVSGVLPDANTTDHTGEVTGGTGLTIDRTTSFNWLTGIHTFRDALFQWQNPAVTFQYIVRTSAIVADRDITLPLLTTGDTFVFNSFPATLSSKTINTSGNTITINFGDINTATKATLEGRLTDVADLAEADGDTYTGVHDFGGASLEITNSDDPTTSATVPIAYDNNNDSIEAFDAGRSDSYLMSHIHFLQKTIVFPDTLEDNVPDLPIMRVDIIQFPFGILIHQVAIQLEADAAYSMVFEEWSGDPLVAQADIETVTTGATDTYAEDSVITNNVVDADDTIVLDLPNTNVDYVMVMVWYSAIAGN